MVIKSLGLHDQKFYQHSECINVCFCIQVQKKKKKKEKTNVKQSDVDNLYMQFTHGSRNFYGALNFFILNIKYEKRNNKLFTVHLHVCLHWIYN